MGRASRSGSLGPQRPRGAMHMAMTGRGMNNSVSAGNALAEAGEIILDLRKELYNMRKDAEENNFRGTRSGSAPMENMIHTIQRAEQKLLAKQAEVVECTMNRMENGQQTWSGGLHQIDPRLVEAMNMRDKQLAMMPGTQQQAASSRKPAYSRGYKARPAPSRGIATSKRMLPLPNRVDSTQAPPQLTEGDLQDGLHSLVSRGFIPKDADCTPFFERCTAEHPIPSVIAGPAPLHHGSVGAEKLNGRLNSWQLSCIQPTNVVFDHDAPIGNKRGVTRHSDNQDTAQSQGKSWKGFSPAEVPQAQFISSDAYPSRKKERSFDADDSFSNTFFTEVREGAHSQDPFEVSSPEMSPRQAPLALTDQPGAGDTSQVVAVATFEIREGHLMKMSPDFIQFKNASQRSAKWHRIKVLIDAMEKLCKKYDVPSAVVLHSKIIDLAFGATPDFFYKVEAGIWNNDVRRDLAEMCFNWQEVSFCFNIPGLRYRIALKGPEHEAASYLQATWCMLRMRRWYQTLKKKEIIATKIQKLWRGYRHILKTRSILRQRRKERLEILGQMEQQFSEEYASWNFARPKARRVEVHIASMPVPTHRKKHMQKFGARQNAQFGRIFKVLEDCVDVVYVTADDIHDEILDYVMKIMQFRGIQKPGGRFQIVKPENAKVKPGMSTALALSISQKAMNRVRALTQDRNAYIVPGAPSPDILNLCAQLGLPLLGAGADAGAAKGMTLSANRCGAQQLVNNAQLPPPPHAIDLYCDKDLIEALSELQLTHREHSCWVFKIGDEVGSRAHAYIDLRANVAPLRPLHEILAQMDDDHENANERAPAFRSELARVVPKIAVIANTHAYPNWDAFRKEYFRVGGCIQAVPNMGGVVHATVHVRVEPSNDGCRTRIVGTTEPIFVPGKPLVKAASFCPALHANYPALKQVGMRLGEAAAEQGILGYMSADVVFFPNPTPARTADATEATNEPHIIGHNELTGYEEMFSQLRSPSPTPAASALSIGQDAIVSADKLAGAVPEGHQLVHKDLKDQYSEALATTEKQSKAESKGASGSHEDPETRAARLIKGDFGCPQLMWVVDVSCRLTNEACSLFPMLFASQTDFEESTGVLRLNSRGAKMYQESGSVLFENAALNKNDYGEERYALISPQAMCPGLNKSDYAGVFHAAKMSNLSFDLLTNTGLIFNSLDVFESLVSLTTVARTPQACVSQLAHGLQVVSDIEKATHGAAGKSMGANLDTHDGYDDLYVRDQQVRDDEGASRARTRRISCDGLV